MVQTTEQVEEIAHCEELDDVLVFGQRELVLPALKRVNRLELFEGITTVDLPVLESSGLIDTSATSLSTFTAPKLSSGHISLHTKGGGPLALPALATGSVGLRGFGDVSLPQLQSADSLFMDEAVNLDVPLLERVEKLTITSSFGKAEIGLPVFDFPALQHVGSLTVEGATALGRMSFPTLRHLGSLEVGGTEALGQMSFPVLQDVGSLKIASLGTLEGLSLPALSRVETDLRVTSNPSLTSLELPLLTYVGTRFVVNGNESLPACDVDEVVQRLVAAGAPCNFSVGNNGPACP